MGKNAFSHYLLYDELTATLQEWARRYPGHARLTSAGQSLQGRELWVMEITDRQAGDPETKPALYIDGNLHAREFAGSAVCLDLIERLLTDDAPEVAKLLAGVTLYVLPRVNPDGAEISLTTPYNVLGSARKLPGEESRPGLHLSDLNGDGHISLMRFRDDNGEFIVSERDTRVMVKAPLSDHKSERYSVMPEGLILGWDGKSTMNLAPRPPWNLNLNRNFPACWLPLKWEAEEWTGPYSLSEPETQALAAFIAGKPNIAGVLTYHTCGGLILRPFSARPDSEMPADDLDSYERIGNEGTKVLGYPLLSTYHDFTPAGTIPRYGVFTDWTYGHMGLFSYCVELWSAAKKAGIPSGEAGSMSEFVVRDEESELKLLDWNDRELSGEGFIDWEPFEHPQLGSVEMGGWKTKETLRNPPAHLLTDTCRKNTEFAMIMASALPRLRITDVECEPLGERIVRVTATIRNEGQLPTCGTEMAQRLGLSESVRVELSGTGFQVLSPGMSAVHEYSSISGQAQQVFAWVVRLESGESKAVVRAQAEKAGCCEKEVSLLS